ncbi:FecR family protein [Pedobacter sp. AW1-32]|uniref:FecR family protein n=1 Tax=Pedobacter sp. AW1-32 TaxID=3383026 RepID=UPI003FEED539
MMNQKAFLDLLNRYTDGKCTESERLWVDKWYHNINQKNIQDLSEEEINEMQRNISKNLYSLPQPKKLKLISMKFAIAASVTAAFVLGSLYFYNYNGALQAYKSENSDAVLLSAANDTEENISVYLSDSSKVTLSPHANIVYPKTFSSNKRTVYLEGDAFFAVTKNHKKPFLVYNENIVVKVLGTSFFVKAPEKNQPAQVSVRTGKVQVNENCKASLFAVAKEKSAKPILLTPNQKGVFTQHQLKKTLVEKPIPLSVAYDLPNKSDYNYREETLKNIFNKLAKDYGISIQSNNNEILSYTFTGDLNGKELYEQLDLVCGSISSKYSIQGTSIVVSNKN